MRILCDTHTHTIFSGHAYSTIEECVRAAAERGLELYGATDHFSSMLSPEPDGVPDLRDYQYFLNYGSWPRVWHGVQVMHGCEADIVDLDGNLFGYDVEVKNGLDGRILSQSTTLKERIFRGCDYVIASVHNDDFARGASTAEVTRMYVNALDDPMVLTLGHIGRTGLPIDVDVVVREARDRHKLIEVNEASLFRGDAIWGRCRHIVERCAELGCSVVVNSDTHIATGIGRFEQSIALLDEVGFPEELVADRDAEAFLTAMTAALL